MIPKFVRPFTSLRLTAALLSLALVLVFIGTIAQKEYGLYRVQDELFKSLFVFWAPGGGRLRIPVFPGGYLIGGLMVLNLIAVGLTRLRPLGSKLGLLFVHSGLVLLLLGQLFADLLSVESAMRLTEGETKNYSEDFRDNELVVIDTSDTDAQRVTSVAEWRLRKPGGIPIDQTPLTVEVEHYWVNADLLTNRVAGAVSSAANRGMGQGIWIVGKPAATSTDERNLPAALVEIRDGEASVGTWLVSSLMTASQPFAHDGRTYAIALRPRRHYTPFSLQLIECKHDNYKGTEIPKNFSSRIMLTNPETGENREVLIWMNHPLRYGGNTYYQYQMSTPTRSSTLQVVRNPGWPVPYISCTLVGLGLVWQFLTHLLQFLRRRSNET